MKWIDRKYYRKKKIEAWHRYFVWRLPAKIRERHVGDLAIPQHYVWLGWVERRYDIHKWEYRSAPE
jgi:hypothetical protein